jgi:acyl carrier protein
MKASGVNSNTDTATRCLTVLEPFLVQEGGLDQVARGAPLLTSGLLDSLALANLIVALEIEFSVQIDAENLDQVFASLETLVDYLDSKRSG